MTLTPPICRSVGTKAATLLMLVALVSTMLLASPGEAAAPRAAQAEQTSARPALVKLDAYPVATARQARRHLTGTPRSFHRFVVAELRRTQRSSCAPAETRSGTITTTWYHRGGFAIGSVEACTVGYGVVWRKVKRRWREAVVFQSAADCSQLRRQRVPRNLWRKGFGPMCAARSGYVTYTGPR